MVCMTEPTLTLGQALKSLRELQGKSLKTVADAADISAAYLQKLEKGDVTAPSPHKLHALAEALGVEYLALMRLAGYVVPEVTNSGSGVLSQAFSAQDMTEAEALAVAAYLKIYRQSKKG
ncbi:HTH-type transcriptional repressor RghR [mine drainage metagenome]|uniref:HTH-type transcriptional repressor RghR n=1 Tax=mine drainage metagenome TaxID=410659 RepID=A0A1J5QC53_9ZZZZ